MKRKDIVVIIVPMLIFVIVWISSNIYHSYVNSTIKEGVSVHINPISPSFDTKTIEKIKSRESIIVSEEALPQVNNSTPSATISNTVTPIPVVTGTDQASAGGSLSQ